LVPVVAEKVATSVVLLRFFHLTFTGVAGAAVVGALVVGALVAGAIVAGAAVAGAAVAGAVGVIVLDGADAVDVPAAFVAVTVNV